MKSLFEASRELFKQALRIISTLMQQLKNKQLLKSLIFLLTIALSFAVFFMRRELTTYTKLGYLGILLITFFSSASIFLPLPGALVVIAGGSAFNPGVVAIVSALGETLGELIGYIAGRSGRHMILFESNRYKKIQMLIHKYGFLPIFIFAVIPNPLFDVIGVLAGFLKYSPLVFILTCFMGKLIKNSVLATIGGQF